MRRIATAIGVGTLAVLFLLLPAAANAAFGPVSSFGGSGSGNGQFNNPLGATISGSQLLVADPANGRVQVFNGTGTWQGSFTATGGFAPRDVAIAPGGTLYTASPGRVDGWPLGVDLITWNPPGTTYGIAVDPSSNVYVSDSQNHLIRKYNGTGQPDPTVPTFGSGQLIDPEGMTSDSAGSIYVADPGNDQVDKFSSTGTLQQVFTMPTYTVYANGQTYTGRLEPHDVAVDGSGRLFVPDAGTHSNLVAVFGSDGALQQWFGQPDSDSNTACAVRAPRGIAISSTGDLFVVSTGENLIRRFDEAHTACPAPDFGQPSSGGGGGGGGGGTAGANGNSKPQISFTGFPTSKCVRRNFVFQIHLQDESRIAKMMIFVNHHRVATQTPNEQFWNVKVRMPIRALRRAIPAGSRLRILVVVKATDSTGLTSKARHAFTVCA